MPSINTIIVAGNLTADPDVRETPNGSPVGQLRLAINEKWKDQSGNSREKTVYVDVTVWGSQAKNCQQYLSKGSPVLIEGKLDQDQWEDRETGQKRSKHKVTAQRVQFLGTGQQQSNQGQQQQSSNDNYNNTIEFSSGGSDDFLEDIPFTPFK